MERFRLPLHQCYVKVGASIRTAESELTHYPTFGVSRIGSGLCSLKYLINGDATDGSDLVEGGLGAAPPQHIREELRL